jgi:hypothetical protein
VTCRTVSLSSARPEFIGCDLVWRTSGLAAFRHTLLLAAVID